MDDSAIICDEVIMSYEGETNVNETKESVKQKFFTFYLFINYHCIINNC